MSADDKDLREHELRVEAFWNEKLESAVNALAGERATAAQERSKRQQAEAALTDEQKRSADALTEERRRHDATNKARLQAFAAMENAVIEGLHRALAEERKAREAAEARFLESTKKPVVEAPKTETPKGWRVNVVQRDTNGFVRSMEVVPK
jgi:hypothetical protein